MRFISLLSLISILFFCSTPGPENGTQLARLIFEPNAVERQIVQLIEDANETIDISLYGFENEPIARALVQAHQMRGVKVRMSTEYDSESSASWQEIINSGIPVSIGNTNGIMHNKYLIFDRKYMLTGSTNLTRGLFKHYNNTVLLKDKAIIEEYMKDFNVQLANGYSTGKDLKYAQLNGTNEWELKELRIGSFGVTPFFTPYKNTIKNYRDQTMLDANFKSSLPLCTTDKSHRCYHGSVKAAACTDQDMNACPLECYFAPDNRVYYRYKNFDADVGQQTTCAHYDHALNVIIPILRNAKKSIFVLAFAFNDRVIFRELMKAKEERNVDVKVWAERNQYRSGYRHAKNSFAELKKSIGFLKISRRSNGGLLHHKVLVVDDEIVILGSLNFSQNAVNSNDENFLIFRDAAPMAKAFREETSRIDQYSYYLPDLPGEEEDRDAAEDPSDL